jgi:hypothetical protein
MKKSEMLELISNHYTETHGDSAIYAYAGALSVMITEEQLEHLIKLKGIK